MYNILTQPGTGRCTLDQVLVQFQVVNMVSIGGGGGARRGGASSIACIPTYTQSTHNYTSLCTLYVCDTSYNLWDESAEFGLMWGQLGGGMCGVVGKEKNIHQEAAKNIWRIKI